jgi:hypothetical protein
MVEAEELKRAAAEEGRSYQGKVDGDGRVVEVKGGG